MAFDPPIAGQTPLDDISGLRDRTIRTTATLNAAEAENIRKAAVKYLAGTPSARTAPFDVAWMKRLHREMFGDVWEWAGSWRKAETNIGTRPASIEVELTGLAEDLMAWAASAMPLDEQSARLHHVAVRTHPFKNGNGRWARMLANIWLKRAGSWPVEWPEGTIGAVSVIREEYLAAVRAADNHDISALLALHRRYGGARRRGG